MPVSPTIRVRVTPQLMGELARSAKKIGKNYSQIVRESLAETLKIKRVTSMPSPGRPVNPEKLLK